MRTVVALFLVALFSATATRARADEPTGVFIVGDSHVRMLGPMLSRQLSSQGFRVLGWESRHGWSTARYRQHDDLRQLLEEHGRPEIVVVSLGGNDFVRSRERYRQDMAWVIEQAHAAGARKIVWIGPATSDGTVSENAASTALRHERNAEMQRELLPSLGVQWVDSRPMTLENHGRDGVHFTRNGYTTWANGAFAQLIHTILPDHVA